MEWKRRRTPMPPLVRLVLVLALLLIPLAASGHGALAGAEGGVADCIDGADLPRHAAAADHLHRACALPCCLAVTLPQAASLPRLRPGPLRSAIAATRLTPIAAPPPSPPPRRRRCTGFRSDFRIKDSNGDEE
jgi:hypothetical protein